MTIEMTAYDWLVIGGGITGAALSYELAQKGFKVLLLEKDSHPSNATRFSYGGLAYWSGTTELTRQLSQEGIERHRGLAEELEADTEFRELDLLLTIDVEEDPQSVAALYDLLAIPPRLLTGDQACEREPLLNPNAIAGVLQLPHAHINAYKTTAAYLQAFERAGGVIKVEPVVELRRQNDRVDGVNTLHHTYSAANTVVCAGGLSRALLKAAGIDVRLYFTHDFVLVTPPVDLQMRTLVMPARLKRFSLEEQGSRPELEPLWTEEDSALAASVLDPGAIQFRDGRFCLGQISQIQRDPNEVDWAESEAQIRTGIARILPSLANLPATAHHCLVAYADQARPLVGAINSIEGVHLFSGFTSTLVFAPPLAKHFAHWATGAGDRLIPQLSIDPIVQENNDGTRC